MRKNKMKTILTEEEGSGLVLALMVLLVMSVLGASLGIVTVGSYQLGDINRDNNSAYYIAEAGANMAYEEIEKYVLKAYEDSNSSVSFFEKMEKPLGENNNENSMVYNEFDSQIGNQPTATIKVMGGVINGESKQYTVESVGEVAGKTRTVQKDFDVTWKEKNHGGGNTLPEIPSDTSIVVRNNINFNGGYISGDIYIDSANKHSFRLGESGEFKGSNIYTKYPHEGKDIYVAPSWRINNPDPKYMEMVDKTKLTTEDIIWEDYNKLVEGIVFPNPNNYSEVLEKKIERDSNIHYVIRNGNILINNYLADNYELIFTKDTLRANKLEITGDRTLKVSTGNKTVNLIVNELNMSQGKIEIIDNGTLNLYVLNKFTYGGSSKINQSRNPQQFNLFYGGNQKMTVGGDQYINGGVYISHANLILTGSGNFNGPILSNGTKVSINGGSINDILLFAPKANVTVDGGGQLKGILVADQLKLDGGARIEFREYDSSEFPFGSNPEEGSNETPDDLISTQPAIESD